MKVEISYYMFVVMLVIAVITKQIELATVFGITVFGLGTSIVIKAILKRWKKDEI